MVIRTLVLGLCSLCLFGTRSEALRKPSAVDSLFQAALAMADTSDPEAGIKAFRQVLKADRDFAPAHEQLARLHC